MVQKFEDVVPTQRESTFDGVQVQVSDLIDQSFEIVKAKVESDDRGEWADVQINHGKDLKTFITGSKPLIDAIKVMVEKKLLDKEPIETTLRSKKSKATRFSYYVFE